MPNSSSSATGRTVSAGLLIVCPDGWLLAHATRTSRWDLPKGKIEPGETPLEAALRETIEETGLDFSDHSARIEDFGQHPYLPRKDLHLFRLVLDAPVDLKSCSCSTYVVRNDPPERYPETDGYAWFAPADVFANVGKSLTAYLVARGLLAHPTSKHARIAGMRPA